MTRNHNRFIGSLGLVCVMSASLTAQKPTPAPIPGKGKAFFFFNATSETGEPAVAGAPYSADVTTRVDMLMFDGTRLTQTVTAKVYRDSAGRTRREQAVIGMEALDPNPSVSSVVQIVDPVAHVMYTLNPGSKTALQRPIDGPPVQVTKFRVEGPPTTHDLGTKTIEGLTATGRRIVTTIATGQVGNDRPIEIIDETWMSTELKVALQTLHRDPRTGDVEYTLTKISRQEPDPGLFKVPAGYQIRRY